MVRFADYGFKKGVKKFCLWLKRVKMMTDEMKDDEMNELEDRVLNLKFKLDRLRAEIGVAAWAVVLLWAVALNFLIF